MSIFIPIRRYRCRSLRCNWEGDLRKGDIPCQGRAAVIRTKEETGHSSRHA